MKQLYIKSFDTDGNYIKTITDFRVGGFTKKINSGIGSLTLRLARKLDAFNASGDVSLGNRLELYLTDEDTGSSAVKVYTGYVEQQMPRIDGGDEYVEILCLSVASYLVQDVLKDGAQTTLYTNSTDGLTATSGSQDEAEIADVMTAIIDRFREENTGYLLNYSSDDGDTIEETGKDIFYTFQAMRYADALKKCKDTAPQNWYWYIDQDEVFYFKASPSVATHTFTIGKDVASIEVTKGLDSVKNIVLVFAESIPEYKQYKDDTSISLYGRRVEQISDPLIGDEATMDNIGNSFIDENKDPRIRIVLEILDNNESDKGYDIESIDPGETCKIVGIDPDESLFTSNMIIQEVDWSDGKARVIIETRPDFDFDTFLVNLRKNIDKQQLTGIPESYT